MNSRLMRHDLFDAHERSWFCTDMTTTRPEITSQVESRRTSITQSTTATTQTLSISPPVHRPHYVEMTGDICRVLPSTQSNRAFARHDPLEHAKRDRARVLLKDAEALELKAQAYAAQARMYHSGPLKMELDRAAMLLQNQASNLRGRAHQICADCAMFNTPHA